MMPPRISTRRKTSTVSFSLAPGSQCINFLREARATNLRARMKLAAALGQAMKISSVMSRDVQLIKPDDTIRSAAALMKKIDAGLLPVTENDKLVGMITDRDIAIRGVAEGKGPDAKVRDAMSPEVKYCFEDEDVTHVAENMAELQVRRLPVMNRDKRLVGIVSLADLAIEGSLPKTAKALHGISQPGGQHNQSRPSA
jgi:CBS domain-containing protein